jgi:DNA replication protein DnaC
VISPVPEPGQRPVCPIGACDGSGWILGPEDVARECECRTRTVNRARLRGVASVIPAKYRGVSFDRPPVTQINELAVQRVRDYCRDLAPNIENGRGLWFFGNSGTGKTTLAMLVSKTALEMGRSVAIYSLPKLLARIRRSYDAETGEQSHGELFERLTSVDLLHIDDLGAEKTSEWVLEQLYALVNERYESQRALMVTTNHDESELEKQIGERVVSRLAEMCDTVPLFGDDSRWRGGDAPTPPGAGEDLGDSSMSSVGPLDH